MIKTCARAEELGLPALAFTEHLDHTKWRVELDSLEADHLLVRLSDNDGILVPPIFNVAGYLNAVQECRARFPELRILTGVELGEPHRHPDQVAEVLRAGHFDRVLGSVHTLADRGGHTEPPGMFTHSDPDEVLRAYLVELAALITGSDVFAVLAHIDYPVRAWPITAKPFDPKRFESEFRYVLGLLAATGRALEVSTVLPLHTDLLRWWHDEGGHAITFGSDAHDPTGVARGFTDAVQMAEAHGFRPSTRPHDIWGRQ